MFHGNGIVENQPNVQKQSIILLLTEKFFLSYTLAIIYSGYSVRFMEKARQYRETPQAASVLKELKKIWDNHVSDAAKTVHIKYPNLILDPNTHKDNTTRQWNTFQAYLRGEITSDTPEMRSDLERVINLFSKNATAAPLLKLAICSRIQQHSKDYPTLRKETVEFKTLDENIMLDINMALLLFAPQMKKAVTYFSRSLHTNQEELVAAFQEKFIHTAMNPNFTFIDAQKLNSNYKKAYTSTAKESVRKHATAGRNHPRIEIPKDGYDEKAEYAARKFFSQYAAPQNEVNLHLKDTETLDDLVLKLIEEHYGKQKDTGRKAAEIYAAYVFMEMKADDVAKLCKTNPNTVRNTVQRVNEKLVQLPELRNLFQEIIGDSVVTEKYHTKRIKEAKEPKPKSSLNGETYRPYENHKTLSPTVNCLSLLTSEMINSYIVTRVQNTRG